MNPIDFYFDFSSPYGYLASQKIEALAAKHGRTVDWHPMLLGVVFKQTGAAPLTEIPVKGPYSKHDFARSARFHGVEFNMPPVFPIPAQAPSRIVLWAKQQESGRRRAAGRGAVPCVLRAGPRHQQAGCRRRSRRQKQASTPRRRAPRSTIPRSRMRSSARSKVPSRPACSARPSSSSTASPSGASTASTRSSAGCAQGGF